ETPDAGADEGAGSLDAPLGADAMEAAPAPYDDAACARLPDGAPRLSAPMVRIDSPRGSYCIDAWEGPVADFNAYLAADAHVDTPPECRGALPPPPMDTNPLHAGKPVGMVGICDAWSYCRWADKRLCGAIGDGGSVSGLGPDEMEWTYACKNGD